MSKTVPTTQPVVNIKRAVYAMATTDGQSAEITMYGDIYEQRPTDWDGNPVEGEFVLLSEFMDDLEQIATCKDITIRMNSYGGDAGVSITIHNRLRELARDGAKLTCIVDGVAMSGGSLIMCACDAVKVNPSSLVMIHKCWTFLFGGYNADEMRALADKNTAWDKAQVTIYKRKTGLSDTVLTHMMADTTYMTGGEAVEKGFADELLEDAAPLDIAASADGRNLFVRGRTIHLAPGMFAPDSIPTVDPEASAPAKTHTNPPAKTGRKGGSTPMASTVEELRAEYPELTAQLEAEARAAATPAPSAAAEGDGGADPAQAERPLREKLDLLEVLNLELAPCGEEIQARRRGYLEVLAPMAAENYRALSRGAERLDIAYEAQFEPGGLAALLAARRDEELRAGQSLCGPHREDLAFALDGQPARSFASQGQQRRLGVAALMAYDCHCLICDEPTYAQDRNNTIAIMDSLCRQAREKNIALVFSTHDRQLAADYADEILEIREGRLHAAS